MNLMFLSQKSGGNRVLNEEEDTEFYELIQTQWKRIIADKCDELEKKIKKRLTKGQNFSNNLKDIKTNRRNGEKKLEIEEDPEIYKNLIEIEEDTGAKMSIERYQIALFIAGLCLGL